MGTNFEVTESGKITTADDIQLSTSKKIVVDKIKPTTAGTSGHTVPATADDTLTLLDATQTLTNKTLTAPTINSGTFTGSISIAGTTSDSFEINSDGNGAILDTTGLSADRTFTFPDVTDSLVGLLATQTLTNKTIDFNSNTLTNVASLASIQTLTNKTIDFANNTLTNVVSTTTAQTITGAKTFSDFLTIYRDWSISVATNLILTLDSYGDDCRLGVRRANGTFASPTAVLSGNNIGAVTFRGYHSGGAFPTGANANLQATAAENFTAIAQGTHLNFGTTSTGTIASVTRMRITSQGDVGIGTTTPSTKLHVVGTGKFTGLVSVDAGLTTTGTDITFSNKNLSSIVDITATGDITALNAFLGDGSNDGSLAVQNSGASASVTASSNVPVSSSTELGRYNIIDNVGGQLASIRLRVDNDTLHDMWYLVETTDGRHKFRTGLSDGIDRVIIDSTSMLASVTIFADGGISATGPSISFNSKNLTSVGLINGIDITTLALDSTVVHLAGTETITGAKTFNSNISMAALATVDGVDISVHKHTGLDGTSKVLGTDIDSTTGTNGQVLTANGSGASTWTTISSSGHLIQDEGSSLTQRSKLNFVGGTVTVTDDGGNDATVVTITAGSGSGHTIQDEGTGLAQRTNLNFTGEIVNVTDDAGNDASIVDIAPHPFISVDGVYSTVDVNGREVLMTTDNISPTWVEDYFTATGGQTIFVLSYNPEQITGLFVYVNGLMQAYGGGRDYTASGSTVTFNTGLIASDEVLIKYQS